MRDTFPLLVKTNFPTVYRARIDTLQANLGYRCNQSCTHCHVAAGPQRTEEMSWETMELLLRYLEVRQVAALDLTGGAPELNPHFRTLVTRARNQGVHVMDRCNLTILSEPGQENLAVFLAKHAVEMTASLPCYLEENVDQQRGKGVFESSLAGLRQLNAQGYGQPGSGLTLNLVYNPLGPVLPPDQACLEAAYKHELFARYGIVFSRLLALANMPIQRFGSQLISKGQFAPYMDLLKSAHRDENLDAVMCRNLISVDWQGYVYDCDFNQMLKLPLGVSTPGHTHLSELLDLDLTGTRIRVADHCYGCTAGQGSSCGGALESTLASTTAKAA
ncbi:MAG TPA: arsenosugar biosynthesis radical SAM protein ArsS [Candidatus Competibacteraceae bacterium]|nr:arsenosugar biosynthesis radical SAM protein ArsS [Candidatus Competibacteraceae bacterium]MCP5134001.1 arsenosugar biosynthesis radical SAM protein ArsS [Gammaproteobacteria bacterium]HPF58420.1 arsenosugar biosynthesis radical SAM protein ArsS [Candidatus Competibacteraceae bacterium]